MSNMTSTVEGISPLNLGQSGSESGLPALRIDNAFCRAVVALQGAQLLEFQATGKPPLLWLSERAVFAAGKAIRGGIPLCFPWFGPHPDDKTKPAHGFARNRRWQLSHAATHEGGHTLVFSLHADADTRALWPHDFTAELHMELGRNLRLSLGVHNTGNQPFRFTFAFHSYFPVSDISHTQVEGLDGSACIDQLAVSRTPHVQQGNIVFGEETDRIYLDAGGNYRIIDEGSKKQFAVSANGCRSTIVWNPWQEKTARLADMSPGGWRGMVCVECGNVENNAVTLLPGQQAAYDLVLDVGEA